MLKRYDIDRIDQRDPALIARFAQLAEPLFRRFFRPTVRGLERVPEGAGLYVGNHSGGLLTPDTFVFGCTVLRELGIDHLPYGLGHEVAISLPLIHQLIVPLGAVRAGHAMAERVFADGKKALVYPGGDLDAMRAFRDRDRVIFGPRRGYIRLALRSGVPIIPVVAVGGHHTYFVLDDGQRLAKAIGLHALLRVKVCPIALSVPYGLTVGTMPPHLPLPSRMFIEVLEPITFPRVGPEAAADEAWVEACHQQVHGAMQSALERLASERRALGWRRFVG